MENLRNQNEASDPIAGPESDYVSYDDETTPVEPPPAIGRDERRMHVRAYNYWAGLLGEQQFPNVEDLNPERDDDFGPNSVLLDFTNGVENPSIQFLGDALREECDLDSNIQNIEEVPPRSLLSRITDHYLQIIANQAPIGFEAEFVNQRGAAIMYRGILLPFSTDNDTIDFIYGVINWKEVAGTDAAEELEKQVESALRSAPAKLETGPIWADAPTAHPIEPALEPHMEAALEPAIAKDEQALEPLDLSADDIVSVDDQLTPDSSLADWLSAARNSADDAAQCEQRSRVALYHAIGQAYDFYLTTEDYPEDYQELLEDAGLKAQDRAPMTPIVKLVFGVGYDKTRLTEYASALRYAAQTGIAKGQFASHLENHDGGLKAIVAWERASRNSAAPAASPDHREDMLEKLRAAPARQLAEIESGDAEFVVLVARRDDNGQLAIVGPVLGDQKFTDRALKNARV